MRLDMLSGSERRKVKESNSLELSSELLAHIRQMGSRHCW
jgi:hypothetical protein